MEYVIVSLLGVIILLLFVLLFRKNNNSDIVDKISKYEISFIKEISDFKQEFSHNISDDFNNFSDRIDNRIRYLNDKVNERLDDNFQKTNKTFTAVLERISRIDEAQKKIDVLSTDIISLQEVLTDKKTRGIFGEVNLKHILSNIFGENNDKIYKLQYKFDNDTIADCVLFAPEPLGLIAIDSKFPLENYQIMVDKNYEKNIRDKAEKMFKSDMKKHIDAISSKYIIPGVTSDQAILFLPAEAIFAEVNAYYSDLLDYAYKKKVWITSPTTLISTLTTIQVIIKNMERDKYTKIIHHELLLLDDEFKRYKDRWDKLYRSIETVSKDVKDIHTTTDKITKRFDSINQVEMDTIKNEKQELTNNNSDI